MLPALHKAERLAFVFVGIACLLGTGAKADGCHEPSLDIGDEAGLAADICTITTALKRSPPDYLTAYAYYRLGYDSRDVTLKQIASGDVLTKNSPFVGASLELFGEENWMESVLEPAFSGSGVFENVDDLRRATFIEKVLQGGALSHRLFSNAQKALKQAGKGSRSKALEFWERGLANFFGSDTECSIFGTGHLRGIEFGVMNKGTSLPNYDIVEAFGDGALAIEAKPIDEESLQNAVDEIYKNVMIIFLQCIVKYTTKIADNNDVLEAQAEGFGYYHAIAGEIAARVPDAHEVIYGVLEFPDEAVPQEASEVRAAVQDVLDELGVDEESFGEYDAEARDNYKAPKKVACEAVNPFAKTDVEVVDFDR